ncbi:MAG TPA: multiubiquitin domain-containing protein [Nitrososphaera sp.]|nr:multiubiquitin domain-containing protein [Nitrososphaera sp.]
MSPGDSQNTDDFTIFINEKEYQSLKKIVGKDQLLELANLDTLANEIFLLDGQGRKVEIDDDEGIQLRGGMRFVAQPQ